MGRSAAGVVLTGGASSRMGTDKALTVVDGRPMAVRVADALWEAGCHPVWCQGGDAPALTAMGLDVVADSMPGGGPLTAIRSALEHAGGADLVVAACDLVDLDADTVEQVLAAARDELDVVVAHADGHDHLLAWWAAGVAGRLGDLVESGVRSVREALAGLEVERLAVDPAAIRNVNRVADLDGPAGAGAM